MAVTVLSGRTFGEISETDHPALRVFNMLVVFYGVRIMVYVFSIVTAFLVEGELTHIFWRRNMEKRIRELTKRTIRSAPARG